MLQIWLKAMQRANHPEVEHLLFFAGEPVRPVPNPNIRAMGVDMGQGQERPSIGYYHNIGANLSNTEWIMKLDVDALPNEDFFAKLLAVLGAAQPKEWFNVGMFYVNKEASERFLNKDRDLVSRDVYWEITRSIHAYSSSPYRFPAASNFVCRKQDYLRLGGCDQRFKGYGWEDYQQLYMQERYWQGKDPLPGPITLENVTRRCRDEISRPKARQLWERDRQLALLHVWHPPSKTPQYRSKQISNNNRRILLEYILKARTKTNCTL